MVTHADYLRLAKMECKAFAEQRENSAAFFLVQNESLNNSLAGHIAV